MSIFSFASLRRPLLAAALASVATISHAQGGKPECLAPAKPGGGYDLTCRLASNGLEKTGLLETPMLVNYMPGGIGAVAFNHVNGVRSGDADLLVAASTGAALNLALGKFGRQYTADDVRWVGALGVDYGAIVVAADAPWQSLAELMQAIKDKPSSVVIGAGGTVGSQDWMKAALMAKAAGVDPRALRYVSFEGGGESLAALLGGHIQVFTGDLAELKPQLESGTIRVLAALSDQRMEGVYADIPTAKEQGYDVEWPIWRGYYMGPEVSDAEYNAWVERLQTLDGNPAFGEMRAAQGLFPMGTFGQEFDAYVKNQVEEFRGLAKEVGLVK